MSHCTIEHILKDKNDKPFARFSRGFRTNIYLLKRGRHQSVE